MVIETAPKSDSITPPVTSFGFVVYAYKVIKCGQMYHRDLGVVKIAGYNKRDARKAKKRLEKLDVARLLNYENPCQFTEADYLMPKVRLRRGETVQQCAIL